MKSRNGGLLVKRVLGVLIALVVAVAGVSVTLAQTSRTTSDKKTTGAKRDETMTAKTAVGTAKSVSADSLVVAGQTRDKETEWTFAVVSATTVRKAGRKVTASELKPGDLVRVRYVEHDGKSVAQNIAVTTPAK